MFFTITVKIPKYLKHGNILACQKCKSPDDEVDEVLLSFIVCVVEDVVEITDVAVAVVVVELFVGIVIGSGIDLKRKSKWRLEKTSLVKASFEFAESHFYLWNSGLVTEFSKTVLRFLGFPPTPPKNHLEVFLQACFT